MYGDPLGLKSFGACLAQCSMEQFGLTDLFGPSLIGLGSPLLSKPGVLGAKEGTSIASKYLGKWFPYKLSFRVPTPNLFGSLLAKEVIVGRILGRFVPYVGWGLVTYDAASIAGCMSVCLDLPDPPDEESPKK